LKAYWQCLHGVRAFNRNFCNYLAAEIQPAAFLPFSPSTADDLDNLQFRHGVDRAQRNNLSIIETISPLRIRFCSVG
jgi:hypothetical protein